MTFRPRRFRTVPGALACALLAAATAPAAAQQHAHPHPRQPAGATSAPVPVDSARPPALRVEFAASVPGKPGRTPVEREEVDLRVRLTDPVTGRPATGLVPFAWVDVTTGDDEAACRTKVGAFTEGTLHVKHGQINLRQPVDDLNGHYIAVLARTPHVAVLDPVKGFGRTRLLTTVPLRAPGADWATTPDDRRLFVTLPDSGEVAAINTLNWKLERTVKAGARPTRAAVHPSGRTLWVTNDAGAAGGVTVLDAASLAVLATLRTGTGPHVVAFSGDGGLAFVSGRGAGTVTVIDAAGLRVLGTVATGRAPVALAWSSARNALFVADEAEGSVAVVDAAARRVVERIAFAPGIRHLRFAPVPAAGHGEHAGHGDHAAAPAGQGRLLFVLNPKDGSASLYDAVERRVVRTLSGAPEPDQVGFSPSFAYVRAAGTASVAMIPLARPTEGAIGPHDYFPAGGAAPGAVEARGLGDVVVPAPGMHDAVYVANPAERMVYLFHYMEGMPIPHGGLTTYTFEPRAIRTVARGLRETAPGVYEATVRLEQSGRYDLVLRNTEPYLLGCWQFEVQADPGLHASEALRIEPVGTPTLVVGPNRLRFRAVDRRDNQPVADLADLWVQLSTPAGWQQRMAARPVGDGTYEVEATLPEEGIYYVAFEAPSRGLGFRDRAPVVMRAGAAPASASPRR